MHAIFAARNFSAYARKYKLTLKADYECWIVPLCIVRGEKPLKPLLKIGFNVFWMVCVLCALCTSVHSPEIFSNEFAQNQQEIAVKMHQVKVSMKRW